MKDPSFDAARLRAFTTIHMKATKSAKKFSLILTDLERLGRRAALAIVNTSATLPANVHIDTVLFQGCPKTVVLAPLNRIAAFLDELCGPASPRGDAILVEITSDQPIAVASIEVLRDGTFSLVPVTAE